MTDGVTDGGESRPGVTAVALVGTAGGVTTRPQNGIGSAVTAVDSKENSVITVNGRDAAVVVLICLTSKNVGDSVWAAVPPTFMTSAARGAAAGEALTVI